MYVDDVITGGPTVAHVLAMQTQLQQLMQCGRFELRKFASNAPEIISHLPSNLREAKSFAIAGEEDVGTLCVRWFYLTDQFGLQPPQLTPPPLTKRLLLSNIARIYDPMGWCSPVTITLKLMLKQLWHDKFDWDDPLSSQLSKQYSVFHDSIDTLTSIRVPRWSQTDEDAQVSLHGYCDASEQAYAAVIYLRSQPTHGQTAVTLLISKTKVAPVKQQTLP